MHVYSYLRPSKSQLVLLKQKMRSSSTYKAWYSLALEADELEGLDLWRSSQTSRYYDYRLIKARLDSLCALSNCASVTEGINQSMFLLRAGMIRNLGGICNHRLYRYSRIGTKLLIEEYVEETNRQLWRVCTFEHPEVGIATKIDFFGDLMRSFGRSALILHGGASFGLCHLGVARSLHSEGLLPKIICGSYIGALIAAAICVQDEDGLKALLSGQSLFLQPFQRPGGVIGSLLRRILRLIWHRCLLDVRVLEKTARKNIGSITFKEAYAKSGRILNIVVHSRRKHEVPVLLNYLTAPDVIVWSAACASCAVPGIYASVTLLSRCSDTGEIRPWHPSTVRMESAYVPNEIPKARLAELFNVNSFIVSQVPSYFSIQISPSDELDRSSVFRLIGDELVHRYSQAKQLGLIPSRVSYFERFFHAPVPGDVTLSPTIYFSDIVHIMQNPTPQFVQYCIRKGERSVWKRMCQLRMRSAIEYEMERIHADLKKRQTSGSSSKHSYWPRSSMDSVLEDDSRPAAAALPSRVRSFEF